MRDHVRMSMIYLLLAALLAVVPVGIARHMLSISRTDAFIPDRPNYLAHQYPPKGEAELTSRLAKLLNNSMKAVGAVPRIFMAKLPEDLPEIDVIVEKKRLFVSSLLPLVLRANELIVADRGRLLTIRHKIEQHEKLTKPEAQWLRKTAREYREKLPLKVEASHIDSLLLKIDVIPPSLAIAQAAIESAWGTSKFAQKGNALFGEWVWGHSAKGIIPERRLEGKTHKVKSFDYLLDSVRSYMRNLNRHQTYHGLRTLRAEMRYNGEVLTGALLAPALVTYSERGVEYVDDVVSIIRYNDLDVLDNASLSNS
ncbi:glucosaminidase domain-containing protein [Kordiimonas pumila]|uniref:Glucosaminidase domain-containing protein n=1 Tax=Kordiimonas pumila TaxID=2161677 RepID=A0ABV7D274_9PROT|nr:glucosaminidase domain-containing protein [Kordiimonas pumila]